MNYEILEALEQITRDRNVERELVIETLEAGLLSAVKRRFGTADHIQVEINAHTGDIGILAHRTVVEGEETSPAEISLEKARMLDTQAEVGETVVEKLRFTDFGRNAIQSAKQILIQRIREAEREQIYGDFRERIGEIVSGTVQQISRGDVVVNLGRTEAILPIKEQIRRERYRQGDPIRAYIMDVVKTTKGPQVLLSRTHPGFLEKLFQAEVPEISEGIVSIKGVAREAGERSKVAVASIDERIDPVGACVGMRGSRVQAIVRELSNERIDVIQWDRDPPVFLGRALAPAHVKRVEVDPVGARMIAIVDEDEQSLAIGRSGQNARLAAVLLSGWNIDILSEEQYRLRAEQRERRMARVRELAAVDEALMDALLAQGIRSVEVLGKMPVEELAEILGTDKNEAESLIEAAHTVMQTKAQDMEEEAPAVEEEKMEEEIPPDEPSVEAEEADRKSDVEVAVSEGAVVSENEIEPSDSDK